MSAHVGDLGTDGAEEEGGEQSDMTLVETWRRNPNPVGDSSGVEFLVRPALQGRKAHRSWYREEIRGRRREGSQTENGSRDVNSESGSSSNSEHSNMAERGISRCNNGRRAHENEGQATNARSAMTCLFSSSSPEERDPFWVEVRRSRAGNARSSSQAVAEVRDREERGEEAGEEEEEEDVGEGGSGVMEVQGHRVNPELLLPAVGTGDRRVSRREKNRMRCLRRRQRKRGRWRQLQESQQSSTADPSSSSSSSEEDEDLIREGYICAVCLDVYFCPYMCHPCNHVFCEPCLRTLAKNSPTNTPCPLCRTVITHVFFQKELNQTARTFFPKEYLSRKQNFQKATCAKWPLPSCRKLFRIFGGFQRPSSPMARRRFPHSGSFRVDALDFEDQSPAGWRLDMDMVIIYIYSVNWIIGFFIFCLLCYVFFPSL